MWIPAFLWYKYKYIYIYIYIYVCMYELLRLALYKLSGVVTCN